MRNILKVGVWVLVIGTLGFVGVVWFVDANTPKRERYLIPEGYVGWLCVTYSVPDAMPLEQEDGYRLVKFQSSGVVETSTEGMPGKYKDEYWFYSGSTRRQMNLNNEMGGGYTVASTEAPESYTLMFLVSSNGKSHQLANLANKPNECGPAT